MSPSDAEILKANRILEAMADAEASGKGAVSLDGRLIDYASIKQAEVLVEKANKLPVDDLNALKASAVKAYRAAVERANPFTAVQSCIKKNGIPTPKRWADTSYRRW